MLTRWKLIYMDKHVDEMEVNEKQVDDGNLISMMKNIMPDGKLNDVNTIN